MGKKFLITIITIFSLIATPSFGWWDYGHMSVAQVAYERLAPEVRD